MRAHESRLRQVKIGHKFHFHFSIIFVKTNFLQKTLLGKGSLGPVVPRVQPEPVARAQPTGLARAEVMLWQSKTLQWPAWVLRNEGNTTRIRVFDKKHCIREVKAESLSPLPEEAPGNIKNYELKQAFKRAYAALKN